MQHGTRNRGRFDFLGMTDKARWLVVHDRCSRVMSCDRIEAGADLRAVLESAVAERRAEGWTVELDGTWLWAGFFCNRDGERISVTIAVVEPSAFHPTGPGRSPTE